MLCKDVHIIFENQYKWKDILLECQLASLHYMNIVLFECHTSEDAMCFKISNHVLFCCEAEASTASWNVKTDLQFTADFPTFFDQIKL